jgi:agmatinase
MKLDFANSSPEKASIVVLGFPFDRTSSFLPGSRFAPQFIRQSSYNIEAYSLYHRRSVLEISIGDLGDYFFDRADPIKSIEDEVKRLYQKKKRGVFLGGEHTISLGIVRALRRFYRDLCVIQFDAHADLRDQFLGEKVCHATVMKRITELIGRERLFQLGIRSGLEEEIEKSKNLYRLTVLEHVGKVKRAVGRRPVFFSVDVDVLDPGVLPAVATPEPGGISYQELAQSLVKLKGLNLVGADIVEYNPLAAAPFPSGSVVAGLLKELLLCFKK